nr:uncharacterized protein LOC108061230 [Drosophila takahashii]
MAGCTGNNFRNSSSKTSLSSNLILRDEQIRKLKRLELKIKKLLEAKVETPDVPENKYQRCRVLGKIFSILFDQGPIEQICSLVFTIFSIITSVIVGPEGPPSIKNVPQKSGSRLLPPHIDEPLNVLLDRMSVLCSDPPKLPTETIKKGTKADITSASAKDKTAAPKTKLTNEKKYAANRNDKYSIPERSHKARNILKKS